MRRKAMQPLALLILTATASLSAQATSCMVMGERSARVQASEGEKSPVFLTTSCESLRLVSGKAMVTWVSRDGKAHFAPIGSSGAETLPAAGAEERSANVVWAELTSKREVSRPAFMRALNEERPARVYVPEEGLALAAKADSGVQIRAIDGDREQLVFDKPSSDPTPILLTRAQIKPSGMYVIEWHHAGGVERQKWQAVGAAEVARIDEQYLRISTTIPDEEQRRIAMAMMFEQMKLRVNMSSVLSNQ